MNTRVRRQPNETIQYYLSYYYNGAPSDDDLLADIGTAKKKWIFNIYSVWCSMKFISFCSSALNDFCITLSFDCSRNLVCIEGARFGNDYIAKGI